MRFRLQNCDWNPLAQSQDKLRQGYCTPKERNPLTQHSYAPGKLHLPMLITAISPEEEL